MRHGTDPMNQTPRLGRPVGGSSPEVTAKSKQGNDNEPQKEQGLKGSTTTGR